MALLREAAWPHGQHDTRVGGHMDNRTLELVATWTTGHQSWWNLRLMREEEEYKGEGDKFWIASL